MTRYSLVFLGLACALNPAEGCSFQENTRVLLTDQKKCPFYSHMAKLAEIKCALIADPSLCPILLKETKIFKKNWLCEMRSCLRSSKHINAKVMKAMQTIQCMINDIESEIQANTSRRR